MEETTTPVEDGWYWVSRGAMPGEADVFIGPFPTPLEAATELTNSESGPGPWDEIVYMEPSAKPAPGDQSEADVIANARLVATLPGYWVRSVELAVLRREVAKVPDLVRRDLEAAGLTIRDLAPELQHRITTLGSYDVRGGSYRDQLRNDVDIAGRDLAYAELRRLEAPRV